MCMPDADSPEMKEIERLLKALQDDLLVARNTLFSWLRVARMVLGTDTGYLPAINPDCNAYVSLVGMEQTTRDWLVPPIQKERERLRGKVWQREFIDKGSI